MRRLRSWLLWHTLLVAALIVFAVAIVVLTPRGSGVNFLLIVPMLPLLGLGLPWSVGSVFLTTNDVGGKATLWVLYTLPAVLNLALHALSRGWLTRSTRDGDPAAGSWRRSRRLTGR